MAQNRMRPVREHSRHPAPVLSEQAMADCVNAAVHGAEPLEPDSVLDRSITQAKL